MDPAKNPVRISDGKPLVELDPRPIVSGDLAPLREGHALDAGAPPRDDARSKAPPPTTTAGVRRARGGPRGSLNPLSRHVVREGLLVVVVTRDGR